MKLIGKLLFATMLLAAVPSLHAAFSFTQPVDLGVADVTETAVNVGTITIHTANVGTEVLAANADRLDFEIEVSSCNPNGGSNTTSKLFYSFSSTGISSTTAASSYPWIDQAGTGGRYKITNAQHINYQGPVYIVGESAVTTCKVRVREFESSSQLFR